MAFTSPIEARTSAKRSITRMLDRSVQYQLDWVNHPKPNVAKAYLQSKACINLPALIRAVSRVTQDEFVAALWFATGGSKLVFFMVPEDLDRLPIVARVSRPDFAFGQSGPRNWQEMCTSVSCEFAVLRFLGTHTKVPVPKVHGFSVSCEEGVPPFIVEEWVDADTLFLFSLSIEELRTFGQCMREITCEWNKLRFQEIGTLHPCGPAHEIKPWGSEMQVLMPPFEGPASSVQAWYNSLIDAQMERLRSQNGSSSQVKQPAFSQYQASFALRCYEVLQRSLSASECFQQICSSPLVLIHPDLQQGNILIRRDQRDQIQIAAIIDWELAWIGPEYLWTGKYQPDVIREYGEAWTNLSTTPVPPLFQVDGGDALSRISEISCLHDVITSSLQNFPWFFDKIYELSKCWKGLDLAIDGCAL